MPNTPSTQCVDASRLALFLEERLDETAEAEIQEHVDHCEHCRLSLENVAAAPELWRDLRDHLNPSREAHDIAQGVHEALESEVFAEPDGLAELTALLDPSEDPRYLGRIGVYEICGLIGRGTTGLVLKAHETRLGRFVALKLMLPGINANGSARQRFEREGRAVAAVSNLHVVPVHAVDEHRGLPYIVMKYVPGPSLEQRLEREGALGMTEVVRIGLQVAEGLAAAHAQGIVHRDVKPANVILEDTVERAMVTDFGLARVLDEVTMTKSGTISGTPQYMSPEQAKGASVDPRSDLFSLGSLLYAAGTGRPPFRAENLFGVIHRVCETEPRAMRERNPSIEPWLAAFVGKLMRKDPAQRFQTAAEVAQLLRAELAHLQNPTVAAEPPREDWWTNSIDERPEPGRSHRWLAWAGGLALLAAGAWAVEGTEQGRQLRASLLPTLASWVGAEPAMGALGERWTRDVVSTESGDVVVYRHEQVEAYPTGSRGRLLLDVSGGDVEVVPGLPGRIVVTSERQVVAEDQDSARAALGAFELELAQDQEDVRLMAAQPPAQSESSLASDLETSRYRIEIPEGVDQDLVVTGGELSLNRINGNLRLTIDGGTLRADSIGGVLEATTTETEIFISGELGQPGQIRCEGGRLYLDNIVGELAIESIGCDVMGEGGRGNIDIQTDEGSVSLINCQGDGKITAVRGNVSITGSTGEVSVITSGGDVRLDSNSGEMTVQTSGGNVALAGAAGPVAVFTSLGNVDAVVDKAPTNLMYLAATRGEVRLTIADDVPAVLVAQGNLESGLSFEERTNERGEEARVCEFNGGVEQIRMAASSGLVRVETIPAVQAPGATQGLGLLASVPGTAAPGSTQSGAVGPAAGATAGPASGITSGPADGAPTGPGSGLTTGPSSGLAPGSGTAAGATISGSGSGPGATAAGASVGASSAPGASESPTSALGGLGGSVGSSATSPPGLGSNGSGVSLGGSASSLGGSGGSTSGLSSSSLGGSGLGGSSLGGSGLGGSGLGGSGLGGSGLGGSGATSLGGSQSGLSRVASPATTPDGQLRTVGAPRPGALATVALEEPQGNIDGYTLYLPVGHDNYAGRYPVLLYLQGAFGVGGEIEAVNAWGLTRLLRDETDLTLERNRLLLDGFIVINLHITEGNYDAHPEVVEAILDDVLDRYKGDAARVSVSGLSRGGHGSWGLASKLPTRFAATVPVGADAEQVSDFGDLADVAVWIGHNADDGVVSFEEAEYAIGQYEAANGVEFLRLTPSELEIVPYLEHRHLLTSAPFGGHDAWTELYTSVEFFRWLQRQTRATAASMESGEANPPPQNQ